MFKDENPDVQTEENLDIDLEVTEEATVSDEEDVKAQLERERAERIKLQAILNRKNKKPQAQLQPTPKQEPDTEVLKRVSTLELSEKKRQVGYELGLAPDETDRLFSFAGGRDPKEVFNDPFFQAGLKGLRQEKAVAEATPSSSNRATKVDGKTFAEMTPEERKANWNKITGLK